MNFLFLKFCFQESGHYEGVFMEMEISCLTRTGPGIKNCSVYMVYLQGMSHQFEVNVIYPRFSKAITLNCSSFVYYSWESLFSQNILKGLRDRPGL